MKPRLTVEFINVPLDLNLAVPGEFEWVQVTYNTLRCQRPGQDEPEELAAMAPDGRWLYDSIHYTDFVVGVPA